MIQPLQPLSAGKGFCILAEPLQRGEAGFGGARFDGAGETQGRGQFRHGRKGLVGRRPLSRVSVHRIAAIGQGDRRQGLDKRQRRQNKGQPNQVQASRQSSLRAFGYRRNSLI